MFILGGRMILLVVVMACLVISTSAKRKLSNEEEALARIFLLAGNCRPSRFADAPAVTDFEAEREGIQICDEGDESVTLALLTRRSTNQRRAAVVCFYAFARWKESAHHLRVSKRDTAHLNTQQRSDRLWCM